MNDVTLILSQIQAGDDAATEKLLPLLYDELRRLASQKMAQEIPNHTLQGTALVHEAYLRLVGANNQQQWDSRGHFFAAAGEAMRRILIDSARRKKCEKHGGDRQRIDFDEALLASNQGADELLAVNEALDKLEQEMPEKAKLVKLRFFAGFTIDEAADALGISRATAKRHWTVARAWLFNEIDDGEISKSIE